MKSGIVIPGVICLVIGLLVFQRWHTPHAYQPPAQTTPSPHPPEPHKLADDAPFPAFESYMTIVERPLFNQDRLPLVHESVEVRPSTATSRSVVSRGSPLVMRLAGVVITPEHRIALIRTAAASTPEHINEGGVIDGWRVESIKPDQIVLEQDGRLRRLMFAVVTTDGPSPGRQR